VQHDKAAAELRRQHAELVEVERWRDRDETRAKNAERERDIAEAQRDELLEALKRLHDATWLVSRGHYNEELHDIAVSKARAVIAKMEGQA